MVDASFKKIEDEDSSVGPQAILVCGFSTEVEDTLRTVLEKIGAEEHRIVFCTPKMVKQTLIQALESEECGEPAASNELPQTLVLSGLNGSQLQSFINELRSSGLPRPIFASTTESNLEFEVGTLIVELLREQRQMGGGS